MSKYQKLIPTLKMLLLVVALLASSTVALADYSAPTDSPPTCNPNTPGCLVPINVGTSSASSQEKKGLLSLGVLSLISGYVDTTLEAAKNMVATIVSDTTSLNIFGRGTFPNRVTKVWDNLWVTGTASSTNVVTTNLYATSTYATHYYCADGGTTCGIGGTAGVKTITGNTGITASSPDSSGNVNLTNTGIVGIEPGNGIEVSSKDSNGKVTITNKNPNAGVSQITSTGGTVKITPTDGGGKGIVNLEVDPTKIVTGVSGLKKSGSITLTGTETDGVYTGEVTIGGGGPGESVWVPNYNDPDQQGHIGVNYPAGAVGIGEHSPNHQLELGTNFTGSTAAQDELFGDMMASFLVLNYFETNPISSVASSRVINALYSVKRAGTDGNTPPYKQTDLYFNENKVATNENINNIIQECINAGSCSSFGDNLWSVSTDANGKKTMAPNGNPDIISLGTVNTGELGATDIKTIGGGLGNITAGRYVYANQGLYLGKPDPSVLGQSSVSQLIGDERILKWEDSPVLTLKNYADYITNLGDNSWIVGDGTISLKTPANKVNIDSKDITIGKMTADNVSDGTVTVLSNLVTKNIDTPNDITAGNINAVYDVKANRVITGQDLQLGLANSIIRQQKIGDTDASALTFLTGGQAAANIYSGGLSVATQYTAASIPPNKGAYIEGSVGIGTQPATDMKLDVVGNIKASDKVLASNLCTVDGANCKSTGDIINNFGGTNVWETSSYPNAVTGPNIQAEYSDARAGNTGVVAKNMNALGSSGFGAIKDYDPTKQAPGAPYVGDPFRDSIRFMAYGSSISEGLDSIKKSGAEIMSGVNMTGGLSITAGAPAGDIRFYAGGRKAENRIMTLTKANGKQYIQAPSATLGVKDITADSVGIGTAAPRGSLDINKGSAMWSSYNYGKQLVLDAGTGQNTGMAIVGDDAKSKNWGITAGSDGESLTISAMPKLDDFSTPPDGFMSFNRATGVSFNKNVGVNGNIQGIGVLADNVTANSVQLAGNGGGDGLTSDSNNKLLWNNTPVGGNNTFIGGDSSWASTTDFLYPNSDQFSKNVGIGTQSPSEKLEVAGNIKATGNISAQEGYFNKLATFGAGAVTFGKHVVSSILQVNGGVDLAVHTGNVGIGLPKIMQAGDSPGNPSAPGIPTAKLDVGGDIKSNSLILNSKNSATDNSGALEVVRIGGVPTVPPSDAVTVSSCQSWRNGYPTNFFTAYDDVQGCNAAVDAGDLVFPHEIIPASGGTPASGGSVSLYFDGKPVGDNAWTKNGNDITNSNTGNVNINSNNITIGRMKSDGYTPDGTTLILSNLETKNLFSYGGISNLGNITTQGNVGIVNNITGYVPRGSLDINKGSAMWSGSNYGKQLVLDAGVGQNTGMAIVGDNGAGKNWGITTTGSGDNLVISAMPGLEYSDTGHQPDNFMNFSRTTGVSFNKNVSITGNVNASGNITGNDVAANTLNVPTITTTNLIASGSVISPVVALTNNSANPVYKSLTMDNSGKLLFGGKPVGDNNWTKDARENISNSNTGLVSVGPVKDYLSSSNIKFAVNGGSMVVSDDLYVGSGGSDPKGELILQGKKGIQFLNSLEISDTAAPNSLYTKNSGSDLYYNGLQINTPPSWNPSGNNISYADTGNVGIGTNAPLGKLDITGGASSIPPSSGVAPATSLALRLHDNSNVVLDFGLNNSNGSWLQTANKTDLNANYPLSLNPNGGGVIIGKNPINGTITAGLTLDVAGAIKGTDVFATHLNVANNDFNPLEPAIKAASYVSGRYGGGYVMRDNTNNYAGMWTDNNGNTLKLSAGGSADSGKLNTTNIMSLNYNGDVDATNFCITRGTKRKCLSDLLFTNSSIKLDSLGVDKNTVSFKISWGKVVVSDTVNWRVAYKDNTGVEKEKYNIPITEAAGEYSGSFEVTGATGNFVLTASLVSGGGIDDSVFAQFYITPPPTPSVNIVYAASEKCPAPITDPNCFLPKFRFDYANIPDHYKAIVNTTGQWLFPAPKPGEGATHGPVTGEGIDVVGTNVFNNDGLSQPTYSGVGTKEMTVQIVSEYDMENVLVSDTVQYNSDGTINVDKGRMVFEANGIPKQDANGNVTWGVGLFNDGDFDWSSGYKIVWSESRNPTLWYTLATLDNLSLTKGASASLYDYSAGQSTFNPYTSQGLVGGLSYDMSFKIVNGSGVAVSPVVRENVTILKKDGACGPSNTASGVVPNHVYSVAGYNNEIRADSDSCSVGTVASTFTLNPGGEPGWTCGGSGSGTINPSPDCKGYFAPTAKRAPTYTVPWRHTNNGYYVNVYDNQQIDHVNTATGGGLPCVIRALSELGSDQISWIAARLNAYGANSGGALELKIAEPAYGMSKVTLAWLCMGVDENWYEVPNAGQVYNPPLTTD